MINRNSKDGSQAGWNAGGIGYNQTDECRHPSIYSSINEDINKDNVFTLALPYFPSPGSETVIDEAGYYKGYFCNFCPGSGTPYDFKPPTDWVVQSCVRISGLGTHGCCSNCVVVLVEVEYIGAEIEELIEPEPSDDLTKLILPIGIGIGLLLLSKK